MASLITGASSGLGAALALELAGPGAVLHLSGRDAGRLEGVTERCRARGAVVHAAVLDVTDAAAMAGWVEGAGRLERRVFLGARSTGSKSDLEEGRNRDVEDSAASIQASAATLKAIEAARNGDTGRAQEMLEQAAEEASRGAQVNANAALEQKANSMRDLSRILPSAAAPAAQPAVAPPMPVRREAAGAPKVPPARAVRKAHDEAMQQF